MRGGEGLTHAIGEMLVAIGRYLYRDDIEDARAGRVDRTHHWHIGLLLMDVGNVVKFTSMDGEEP